MIFDDFRNKNWEVGYQKAAFFIIFNTKKFINFLPKRHWFSPIQR